MDLPNLPPVAPVVQQAQQEVQADGSFMTSLVITASVKDGQHQASARFALAAYNSELKILSPDRKTDFKGVVPDLLSAGERYPLLAQAMGLVLQVIPLMKNLQVAEANLAGAQKASDQLNANIADALAQRNACQGRADELGAQIAAINASGLSDENKAIHLNNLRPQLMTAQNAANQAQTALDGFNAQSATIAGQLLSAQTDLASAETALGHSS